MKKSELRQMIKEQLLTESKKGAILNSISELMNEIDSISANIGEQNAGKHIINLKVLYRDVSRVKL